MSVHWDDALRELATARYGPLLARAELLCGDRAFAQDVLHEALASVLRSRGTFDSVSHAERVVRRAIVARYVDMVRSETRRRRRDAAAASPATTASADASVGTIDLERAMATLPPRVRACVALRFLDDLSVRETAALLGLSEGSVKRYVHDGIGALNVALGTRDRFEEAERLAIRNPRGHR